MPFHRLLEDNKKEKRINMYKHLLVIYFFIQLSYEKWT